MNSTSYNAFEHLCASLFLSGRGLVAMVSAYSNELTAYFDESYNHRTEKNPNDPLVFTVACWLAPVQQWKRFGRLWRSALKSADIEHFHMKDYESRFGDYEDWSDLKRIGVLKRLHRIMKDHTIYGCSYSIDRTAFDEITTPKFRSNFAKSCYGFTVFSCMDDISGWCRENGYEGPITYFFAHLQKQGSDLDAFFNRALKTPRLREAFKLNGTWVKGFAKDVPQLQAADIVAYEVNKRVVEMAGASPRAIRKSLQNMHLGSRGRFNAGYYGRDNLQRTVSGFESGNIPTHFPDLYSAQNSGSTPNS